MPGEECLDTCLRFASSVTTSVTATGRTYLLGDDGGEGRDEELKQRYSGRVEGGHGRGQSKQRCQPDLQEV